MIYHLSCFLLENFFSQSNTAITRNSDTPLHRCYELLIELKLLQYIPTLDVVYENFRFNLDNTIS